MLKRQPQGCTPWRDRSHARQHDGWRKKEAEALVTSIIGSAPPTPSSDPILAPQPPQQTDLEKRLAALEARVAGGGGQQPPKPPKQPGPPKPEKPRRGFFSQFGHELSEEFIPRKAKKCEANLLGYVWNPAREQWRTIRENAFSAFEEKTGLLGRLAVRAYRETFLQPRGHGQAIMALQGRVPAFPANSLALLTGEIRQGHKPRGTHRGVRI